jgi:type IV pilus assembly protein PilQ
MITIRSGACSLARYVQALAALFLLGLAQSALAQGNAIESVSSQRDGTSTFVRIKLKNPITAEPASFSIAEPARVALDFTDTQNASGSNILDLQQGDVRSVVLVQAGKRLRVVLNLRQSLTHKTSVDGDTVMVELAPKGSQATTTMPAAVTFSQGGSEGAHALRDVDFRRGKNGEGRVVVELSDSGVGVDVRQQGRSIVVDFLSTRLPDNLRRMLDVGDFGTPVRTVRASQEGANTRLVIEPAGEWEHSAYQSDTQFVVEVKQIREDADGDARKGRYRGERLSLNFQNADIRSLLQVIADFTNLNIVTSDSVSGTLTLRLKDVPWDQALDIMLTAKSLAMRKTGNVIMIAPREEIAVREKLELEARKQISEIEPIRSETFELNYQKAESLAKLLTTDKQRVLSKRGSAVFDERTNKLFVQDTVDRLEAVSKLVKQVDVPVRQVLIEARIVEANDLFTRNLGVRLGYNDLRSTVTRQVSVTDPATGNLVPMNVPVYGAGTSVGGTNTYGTISGNLQGAADLSSQSGSSLDGLSARGIGQATALANTNFVNLPAAAIGGFTPATFAISLFGSSLTRFLNLELSALEADQRGKVVSSPRVLTADKKKATIEQGTELPFQQSTSSGATSVQFRKASLKLEVTPQITPEGNVIMEVLVNRDAVGQLTPAGYAIDKREVRTQVLVENGGTVVIGGIYEQVENKTENKVPLLGDLPVIGHAFKQTLRQNNRKELMVFLTPRIVTDTKVAR